MAISLTSLRKRSDFLALRPAPSTGTPAFRLVRGFPASSEKPTNFATQASPDTKYSSDKEDGPSNSVRVGFTVTKKMGNAVIRNRIKRRLKSATEAVFPLQAEPNADYVVIARRAALDRPFELLIADMEKAVNALRSEKRSR